MSNQSTQWAMPVPNVKRFAGIDWNFAALRDASPRYWAFVSLLLTVLLMGGLAWGSFLLTGGSAMAMRDDYPWGLWFTNYMYYVGLSAGGLVVYASVHLFGAEQFRPLSRLAVLQAGVLVMMALLGIVTDMERFWRAGWMLLTPNPSSPFVYTGSAANIYMIICFVDLWILITGKGGERLAMRMTLLALPFAIYLHTTTAFVLALNKSRELWNTAMMVPIFLTSATASGIALLMISAYIMQRFKVMRFRPSMFRSLSTLLAAVIITDLFLLAVEILAVFWPTSRQPGHAERMSLFFQSPYGWLFIPVLVLGIGAFALLAGRERRHLPRVQITAAAMYVFAIFLKRYSLMAMGFAIDPLGQLAKVYVPSLTEVLIALMILSIGLLVMAAAAKVLPLQVPDRDLDEHAHEFANQRAEWAELDREFEAEAG
ncbi:MAG: NrfD/PsrC family molybdoenzyme membrane anchor subunit [Coriobacteriia bacterium]|jgi:molybdopterin-containing oxidoreductase family membrane subunit|nr:NrfD/PsrC family molybdoenzyme membrane anchor subunit [Coriobacteriia bacterium]